MLWLNDQEVFLELPGYSTTCHVGRDIVKFLIEHGISTDKNVDTTVENVFNIQEDVWEVAKPQCHFRHLLDRKIKDCRDHFQYPDVYHSLLVARDQLMQAKGNVSNAERKVKDYLSELLGVHRNHLEIGSWECIKSPIKVCVYNNRSDECEDYCLFCDGPEERK